MQGAERRTDQAAGLRRLFAARVPVVAAVVALGGRSAALAANLGAAAARLGHRVLLLDESLAEVARALGATARWDLAHALAGDRRPDQVAIRVGADLTVVPAARGLQRAVAAGWSAATIAERFAAPDLLLVHAPDPRLAAHLARDGVAVLLPVDGAADTLANAYLALKNRDAVHAQALAYGFADATCARNAIDALAFAARRFLGRALGVAGIVPGDAPLARAMREQRTVFDVDPIADSARALERVAARVVGRQPVAGCASPTRATRLH
jgi:MinD-like ATPase involved in chromosome partitioning or flagellar assembly